MNKLIENQLVAVVLSSQHNTQWFTNHKVPELLFDPKVVSLVMQQSKSFDPLHEALYIEKYCDNTYGERTYYGDSMYLKIDWMPVGAKFSIVYKDGWESIVSPNNKEVFEA